MDLGKYSCLYSRSGRNHYSATVSLNTHQSQLTQGKIRFSQFTLFYKVECEKLFCKTNLKLKVLKLIKQNSSECWATKQNEIKTVWYSNYSKLHSF